MTKGRRKGGGCLFSCAHASKGVALWFSGHAHANRERERERGTLHTQRQEGPAHTSTVVRMRLRIFMLNDVTHLRSITETLNSARIAGGAWCLCLCLPLPRTCLGRSSNTHVLGLVLRSLSFLPLTLRLSPTSPSPRPARLLRAHLRIRRMHIRRAAVNSLHIHTPSRNGKELQ